MNALITSLNLSPTLVWSYVLFLTTVCGIYIYRIAGTDLKLSQVFSTCVTDFKGWTVKEYLWLFTAPAIICATSLIMGGGWIEFICSVTSIIGAILVAKGKISSYVWGFIGTALYLYISYQYKLYGETITYALLFLPMQVSGYYYWIRNSKEADTDVIKKVMTTKQRIWLFVGTATAIAAYAAFLRYLEGAMPGLDSATAILSIVATTLMVMRYAEQWLIWILVNTVAVVMWVLAVLHHQDQGFAVLAMWSTFWLNSVYGWYKWRKGN
ncbi:hypothetical protein DQT32_03375 [Salmonella enterica subsp. enterica serovar Braenderup]|nr:hypothetical protein [Salmonella enterica subsp. enterica serovar Braenderup]